MKEFISEAMITDSKEIFFKRSLDPQPSDTLQQIINCLDLLQHKYTVKKGKTSIQYLPGQWEVWEVKSSPFSS